MKGSERFSFCTYENVGDVYTEEVGARFGNAILTAIYLRADSDHHDTPVSKRTVYAFRGRLERTEGLIFLLSIPTEGKSVVYIVPAPDIILPTISIDKGVLSISCGGYPVIKGECQTGKEAALCRAWYRSVYKPKRLVSMSNTWGDRGGASVVYEKFLIDEIDAAEFLGLDVMQVDAGWSTGIGFGEDENGLRVFEGDCWAVVEKNFPNGIESISPYAAARGVETGLWFSPHCNGNYKYFDRDIAILKRAHDEWGFHHFKLDALQLNTVEKCHGTVDFIKAILDFGEHSDVDLDVTANQRLGYLACAPYGTLFVENRYTAWSNYYPHATLRNLWRLSEFVCASKLQMELLNPKRFTDKYREDDMLRPETYDIDYMFASVMVSNPLIWMEMQHLAPREKEQLRDIISIWKQYRDELVRADVRPILEEPSGTSLTGFAAETEDALHLILLREVTDRDLFDVSVGEGYGAPTLITSNANADVKLNAGELQVRLDAPRAYAWVRLEKK